MNSMYEATINGIVENNPYDFDLIQPKILKTLNKKELINVIVRQQDAINRLKGIAESESERTTRLLRQLEKERGWR